MLKIAIEVNGSKFALETDAPLSDVAKYLDLWFVVIQPSDVTQAQIDALTARVAAANDTLQAAVAQNTPASS